MYLSCNKCDFNRCAHAAVYLKGCVYAIGGKSLYPTGPTLDKMESYSIEDEEWHSEPKMPIPLYHHCATTYNGNIYVTGIHKKVTMYLF